MEQALREQTFRVFGYSACAVSCLLSIHEVLLGTTSIGWSLLAFSLLLGTTLYWLSSSRSLDIAASVLLFLTFMLLATIIIGSGGRALGANVAAPTVLMLSALLVQGRVGALVVGLGYFLLVGVAAVLATSTYPFPIRVEQEVAALAVYRLPVLMTILVAMVIFPFNAAIARLGGNLTQAAAEENAAHDLRRSHEERLQDVAHLGGDWFWAADGDLRIDYLSPGFEHVTGVSADRAMGMSPADLMQALGAESEDAGDTLIDDLKQALPFSGMDLVVGNERCAVRIFENAGRPTFDEAGRLSSYYGVARDVTHLRETQAKLSALAETDALTGLANRRAFVHALEQAIIAAKYDGSRHAVCSLDLVGFKAVNDKLGRTAGDAALQALAQVLKDNVRGHDVVARMGGDEFGILLRDYRAEAADGIPERIADAIADFAYVHADQTCLMGVSIGVCFIDRRVEDAESILLAAEKACYECKRAGDGPVFRRSRQAEGTGA